jgi:hypothetical protein
MAVMRGALTDDFEFALTHRAHHLGRAPHNDRTRRELLALGNHAARPDQAVLAYLGAIQKNRAHANQAVVADVTPVDNTSMPHGNTIADDGGFAQVSMYHRPILNVRTTADGDTFRIATKDRVKPDRRCGAKGDLADQVGARCNIDPCRDGRRNSLV